MYLQRESCRSRVQSPAGAPGFAESYVLKRVTSPPNGTTDKFFECRLLDSQLQNKSGEGRGMASKRWRVRTILIAAVIVVLSIGIVFASLPYLQPPASHHGSITTTLSHSVDPGSPSHFGFYGLKLPNITTTESFYLGVSVTNGTASFCVIGYQQYENWAFAYNTPNTYAFPSSNCIFGPTQQTSQDTLQFSLTPGTWVVAALNTGPLKLLVYFSPA